MGMRMYLLDRIQGSTLYSQQSMFNTQGISPANAYVVKAEQVVVVIVDRTSQAILQGNHSVVHSSFCHCLEYIPEGIHAHRFYLIKIQVDCLLSVGSVVSRISTGYLAIICLSLTNSGYILCYHRMNTSYFLAYYRSQHINVTHELFKLLRIHGLGCIRNGLFWLAVNLYDDSVSTSCNGGKSHRWHLVTQSYGMAGVNDDGQVGQGAEHWHSGNIQGISGGLFVGTDSPLTQNYIVGSRRQQVFSSHKPFLNSGRKTTLQDNRLT